MRKKHHMLNMLGIIEARQYLSIRSHTWEDTLTGGHSCCWHSQMDKGNISYVQELYLVSGSPTDARMEDLDLSHDEIKMVLVVSEKNEWVMATNINLKFK